MVLDKTPFPPAMDGFEFKVRMEPVDWRTIASIDIDRIIKTVITAINTRQTYRVYNRLWII
jgi:hypothetical protein